MVEGIVPTSEDQDRSVNELQQELKYIRCERDELQITMERIIEGPVDLNEDTLTPADIPRSATLPRAAVYHQLTTNVPPFNTIMQYYHALKGVNLLVSQISLLKPGVSLSKAPFEQIWGITDATANDTLAFMWVKGNIKMPVGVMEVVTGSPPFYVGRFVLRALNFISHHHSTYYNHTPLH
jgi:hypothetical protein